MKKRKKQKPLPPGEYKAVIKSARKRKGVLHLTFLVKGRELKEKVSLR